MLLYQIPGATSFESLKTVDGVICDTFQESCFRMGLLEDDTEKIML